jgi:hypothetical protein
MKGKRPTWTLLTSFLASASRTDCLMKTARAEGFLGMYRGELLNIPEEFRLLYEDDGAGHTAHTL